MTAELKHIDQTYLTLLKQKKQNEELKDKKCKLRLVFQQNEQKEQTSIFPKQLFSAGVIMNIVKPCIAILIAMTSTSIHADTSDDVTQLQHRWAEVNYTLQGDTQEEAFEALAKQADLLVSAHPNTPETLIWRGIIKSSYAGAKGGLGAMSLAKASKLDLEKALSINDQALSGSAYASLGTLYFRVPGWPIGFGDDDKAKTLLEKAVSINPDSIDNNYLYAEFLVEQNQYAEAEKYLLKAQQAPARSTRPVADRGRHEEIDIAITALREKIKEETDDE